MAGFKTWLKANKMSKKYTSSPLKESVSNMKKYKGAEFIGKKVKSGPYAPGKNRKSY